MPPCKQEAPGSLPAPVQLWDQVSTRSCRALIPVCRWGSLPGPTPGKQDPPTPCLRPRDVCRVEALRGAWWGWGQRLRALLGLWWDCSGTSVGPEMGPAEGLQEDQQWDQQWGQE